MYQKIKYFLKYYFAASTKYNVHSALIASLLEVIYLPIPDSMSRNIRYYKNKLYDKNTLIPNFDLGAGAADERNLTKISLRTILGRAVSGKFKLSLLYQIVYWFKPRKILELGTSLGFSGVALQRAANSDLITVEGNPYIAQLAHETFAYFGITDSVKQYQGSFDDYLESILKEYQEIDLVYVDGNHTLEATIRYFDLLVKYKNSERFLIIFDDIYWSAGMQSAWRYICTSVENAYTLDLFSIGIIIFDSSILIKQQYTIVPWLLKPWRLGFFYSHS